MAADNEPRIKISSQLQGDQLVVTATLLPQQSQVLSYEFITEKKSPTGVATTRQKGKVTSNCCEASTLATAKISAAKGAAYTITVKLMGKEGLLDEVVAQF